MNRDRVALIYPHFRTHSKTELLFPPIGIASLMAQLTAVNIGVGCFDGTFSTFDGIVDSVSRIEPAIVGIYTMVTMTENAFALLEAIKGRLPETLFVSGGPLPTVYPKKFAKGFDAVFRGESDLVFPGFCHDFVRGGSNKGSLAGMELGKYDGLFICREGLEISNRPIHISENVLNALPNPDRSGFGHRSYQEVSLEKTGYRTTSIMLTRGCPFNCDFCSRPIFGNYFRKRNLRGVVKEINEIIALGYNDLWIADDSFTLDRNYVEDFCETIIDLGNQITWCCLSRVDGVDSRLATIMKNAGCRKVFLGLESGSQETLRLMNKLTTVESGREAVSSFNEAGIDVSAFFIVGYPGETACDIEKTFDYALSLPLKEVSFNVPLPLPGSPLYLRVRGLDEGAEWNVENEVRFVYESEFDEKYLERRINEVTQEIRSR